MKTKSRIAPSVPQVESPVRHLPLVDLLVDTKTELLELAIRSGLGVFTAMLEEDRIAIVARGTSTNRIGPRAALVPSRVRSCWGDERWRFSGRGHGPPLAKSRCRRS